jgi:hypothetical protein
MVCLKFTFFSRPAGVVSVILASYCLFAAIGHESRVVVCAVIFEMMP